MNTIDVLLIGAIVLALITVLWSRAIHGKPFGSIQFIPRMIECPSACTAMGMMARRVP